MIKTEQYLAAPCSTSSIPLWKTRQMTIPEGMRILHNEEFDPEILDDYVDEPYFRLLHRLDDLQKPTVPEGFVLSKATFRETAAHISLCYGMDITEQEIHSYTDRPVYHPELWVVLRDTRSGEIAASGIAEFDYEIGEGVLEWIQVSPKYRGRGLGKSIVLTLLTRMKGIARFASVSGQCRNPTNPEALYRSCGFTGNDIWHILRRNT